jgi:hypothetical protein
MVTESAAGDATARLLSTRMRDAVGNEVADVVAGASGLAGPCPGLTIIST